MDYMDSDVRCHKKAVKFDHSLTRIWLSSIALTTTRTEIYMTSVKRHSNRRNFMFSLIYFLLDDWIMNCRLFSTKYITDCLCRTDRILTLTDSQFSIVMTRRNAWFPLAKFTPRACLVNYSDSLACARCTATRYPWPALCHDDVIKWKHFPRNWPFVRGIHRDRWIPHTKASDAELWCFLWSAPE